MAVMVICWIQDTTFWLVDLTHWTDVLQVIHWHLPLELAQQFKEPDLWGDVQRTFNNFVKTGQVWAFLIGLVMGYVFRSFTSYG